MTTRFECEWTVPVTRAERLAQLQRSAEMAAVLLNHHLEVAERERFVTWLRVVEKGGRRRVEVAVSEWVE